MKLTVVMYHYVRKGEGGRFSRLKALDAADFHGQLAYLERHYRFVSARECMEAIYDGKPLPPNAILLTFDDGLKDHFSIVYPILKQRGIRAVFFTPALPVLERKVLDAHKIHFILASQPHAACLLDEVRELVGGEELPEPGEPLSRFDEPQVAWLKRWLQTELPAPIRSQILDTLFRRHVTRDEATFADELYLGVKEIEAMVAGGMELGAHGWSHQHLDRLTTEEQREEIERSLEIFSLPGLSLDAKTLAYPYGAYDTETLRLAKAYGFQLAFTTKVGLARLCPENALTLERLDTNDLPKDRFAAPSPWTETALCE